ncbi:hypothetical protein [Candidatus Binatus sp.]|uniref:hypothetical protein n=1 Tax=Candidatus Binatus sp. TaxID=2811406 RepID=UPI00272C67D1|nr:hypothetical protein [Candidatus Binatus sp.]
MIDYFEIVATMAFPSDPEKRWNFVLQNLEAVRKLPPTGGIARQKWETKMSNLIEAGFSLSNFDQFLFNSLPPIVTIRSNLNDESLANFSKGTVAGQILFILIQLAERAPQYATLGKARYLAMTKLREKALGPDGALKFDVALSERSIISAWVDFGTVCHLYAAFLQMQTEMAVDMKSGELSRKTMREWLAVAEMFRKRGQQHRSLGSREPALDETKMWKVPPHIDLKVPFKLSFPPVSKADLAELKNYKHPRRF